MLWLCWQQGVQHDYRSYLGQWRLFLDGANPWSTNNNYGPLHTVVGLLLPFGQLAPKFLLVGALLLANAALVLSLLRERGVSPILIIYLLAVPTNVLVVGVGVIYGLNDALVASLLVAAVLFRLRGNFLATGALIGLAALVKYYPLLLLPFFALNGKRLHWSVIASGLAVFGVGMAAASAIWGEELFNGILHGVARKTKLLSVLGPLQELVGKVKIVRWLKEYNAYLVICGVGVAFLCTWKAGRNWLEAAVLGYLVMLTLYKVGNQQFYLPWLLMVAALPLVNKQSADQMGIILLPAVVLLSLYQFGYEFASSHYKNGSWVRTYGGLIAFAVSVSSITACMIDYWRHGRGVVVESPSDRADDDRSVEKAPTPPDLKSA
jgi:hypothetical protein